MGLNVEEYIKVKKLFDVCNYAEVDDEELHDFGSHRDLYNYLVSKLNLDAPFGRGPIYHYTAKILKETREHFDWIIIATMKAFPERDLFNTAKEWAEYLIGLDH